MKYLFGYTIVALAFVACQENHQGQESDNTQQKNAIIIKGSDTELPMVKALAQSFTQQNPEVNIDVAGGGSSMGIDALINGKADIANSSRAISIDEIALAKKHGVSPVPIMFSVDALAIITNSKLGIDSLSMEQLTQVFSGQITNWKELGGPNLIIEIYGRDSLSGTYAYIKEHFTNGKNTVDQSRFHQTSGNAEIVASVQGNVGGIGYVGAGYLMNEQGKPNGNIWAMLVYEKGKRAYSPYEFEAVKKGDYLLTRPLYQYINGKPNSMIYDFIMSELTLKGRDVIKAHGYFPIVDYQTEINKLNGYH